MNGVSHLRVRCPICGEAVGRECIDLNAGLQPDVGTHAKALLYSGHDARRATAARLYGGKTG